LENAKELKQLQSETGLSYKEITAEVDKKRRSLKKCRTEARRLTEKIAEMQKQEMDLLSQNKVTKEQLAACSWMRDRFVRAGISFDQLENVRRFLINLNLLNYDSNQAIKQLCATEDLHKQTKLAEAERGKAQLGSVEEQRRLNAIQEESRRTSKDVEDVTKRLAESKAQLIATDEKIANNSSQIRFAEAIAQLMGGKEVSLGSVLEFKARLEFILRSKIYLAAYPIDYRPARETAISLFEQCLGKYLVAREVFDEMLHRAGKEHDDSMLDQLVDRERILVGKTFQEFAEASEERLLPLAARQQEEGIIRVYRCSTCGKAVAFASESAKGGFRCPFCGSPPSPAS